MRIRIWNAFASNNSGSYTIVGTFRDAAVAADVAAELAELMSAHTAWLEAEAAKQKPPLDGESPLQRFVQKRRLTSYEGMGVHDEWPQYSPSNVPQAFAVGHTVIIHHDYTVTMPPVFGEYFYARGGRVSIELNHAHYPIVGIVEMWVHWKERKGVDVAAKVAAVMKDLNAEDGPLVANVPLGFHPAWQSKDRFGEADLTVGAVFDDLLTGFSAVTRIAAAHGLEANVRVFEAVDKADPVSFLRPSSPPLETFSVVLDAGGPAPDAITHVLATLFDHDYPAAKKLLASVPVTVMSALTSARAAKLAAILREAGATASVKPEPARG